MCQYPRRKFRRGSACKLEKLKRRKKLQRNEVDLGLGVRSGVGACNAAEGDDVGVSVAAQTVVAVDAAGHLTGCVQTGDGAAVGAPGLAASTAAAQLICYNQNRAIPERGRQPRAAGGADEI